MTANPLVDCGKPLFFKVADAGAVGLVPPPPRLGNSVRLAVRSLSVMQKEALVVNSATGAVWRLASDEGAYLAGQDEAPCPLSFFTTGMVCATLNEALALAAARGITVRNIRLIQDNYYTMRGSALKGTMTGGAKDVELEAEIDADAPADVLRALIVDAVAATPVSGLLRKSTPSLFTLNHNGRTIELGRAIPIVGAVEPDPEALFDRAEPAAGDWPAPIRRGGMTPKTEATVTLAGGSLAEEQDRILHVRGICTVRPDGIREVEQHLFNPHGSIFTYLCEEGPAGGGQGRAPDAASYVAAGIGFCFMTQFGRYAKIARKDLEAYRVLQDAHFSPGGSTGGTGQPGEMAPLETHVHICSGEDDDFARRLLDMSEQTCFLHALCKAALRTRVRLTQPAAV